MPRTHGEDDAPSVLAIAATPLPGEAVLPPLLPRFHAAHPKTSVREWIGDEQAVVERLLQGDVELAVIGGPYHDEDCTVDVIARDEFALIAPRGHPLTLQGPATAERVSREPLVLREEGSGARAAVEAAFASAGLAPERVRVAAELGSTEAVKAAVAAGLGIGFVSICALVTSGPAGVLRALPMADFAPARDLLLLRQRGRELGALAEAFREFLLSDEIRRLVAASTRLPAHLRPGAPVPDDPLLEPTSAPPREVGMTRPPRSEDEQRVAAVLARIPVRTRDALIAAVADDLRRAEGDPFRGAPETGVWRLSMYRQAAEDLVRGLLGDFLVERAARTDPAR